MSLPDMSYWLMDLRLKLRFRGGVYEGQDADYALLELTPADAAMPVSAVTRGGSERVSS